MTLLGYSLKSFLSFSYLFYPKAVGVKGHACAHSHSMAYTQPVGLLWTEDRLVAETSNWLYTSQKWQPCPRRDSIPESERPQNARPLGSAL